MTGYGDIYCKYGDQQFSPCFKENQFFLRRVRTENCVFLFVLFVPFVFNYELGSPTAGSMLTLCFIFFVTA